MIKRNLDIGFSDGYVTPWLVTTVECSQGQMPTSYRIPNLGFVLKYGFSIRVEMTPGEWEKAEILKAAYPDKRLRRNVIEPDIHFPLIMDFITAQAVERYGPEVNIPYSEQLPQPQAVISQKFTTQTENSIYTSLFH